MLTPALLFRSAIAGIWLYEGMSKALGRDPGDALVAAPHSRIAALKALGLAELVLAAWVVSGSAPLLCACAQTLLLALMLTDDVRPTVRSVPTAVLAKNVAFLAVGWVAAGL
jgi:hypothetical protein